MIDERTRRRLSAVLSADAVGFSRLMAEDEAGTARALAAAQSRIRALVEGHGGRVVDAPGDNLLAEFPSALSAVECAVEIQEEHVRWRAAEALPPRLAFRIGVHVGEVLVAGERIQGHGVNVAARLEALAEPGGVCLSGAAFEQVDGKLPLSFEYLGEPPLKNLPKPIQVYRCLLSKRVRFADFELDVDRGELRRDGLEVPLQRKPLQLLAYLARHRDRWVSKQELFENVWPDVAVSDAALFSALRDARRALSDDGSAQRWIQTERGRGFHFAPPAAASAASPTPSSPEPAAVLVGRRDALARLEAALDGACRRHGRVVLLSGDAGIGKTRLAQEIARRAEHRGLRALWGRCWDGEGAPPFWPWVGVLRGALRGEPPHALARRLGSRAEWIALLLPELRATVEPVVRMDSPDARFLLFDAAAAVLRGLGEATPLVVVLDDLHWADPATLELLRFVALHLGEGRILVVGTLRESELAAGHPLRELLPGLLREEAVERIALSGLTFEETTALVALCAEVQPDAELARAIHERTRGNPYFVEETVRALRESLPASPRAALDARRLEKLGLAEGIRRLLAHRVAAAGEECSELLQLASVIGQEFDLPLLQAVASRPVAAPLERAVAARLVAPRSEERAGYAFSHPLVREALYEGIAAERRRALHREVGEALARTAGAEPPAALLAFHFERAGGACVDSALGYATRAARGALAAFAFEDAALGFQRALALQERQRAPDPRARLELLLGLGEADRRGEHPTRARETYERALDLARGLGSPSDLARAAVGLELARWVLQDASPSSYVPLLEEALAGLAAGELALRSEVLSRLAFALTIGADPRGEERGAEAVEVARRSGDAHALAGALAAYCYALWRPARIAERVAFASELTRTAPEPFLVVFGHEELFRDALRRGDLPAAERAREAVEKVTREHHVPWRVALCELHAGTLAALQGRFDDAERAAAAGFAAAARLRSENVRSTATSLFFGLRMLQGRLAEVLPALDGAEGSDPTRRAARLLALHEAGREEEARAGFEALASEGFEPADFGGIEEVRLAALAELCARLHAGAAATTLARALEPYAPLHLLGVGGGAYAGSSLHFLGLLERARGARHTAIGLLERALESYRKLEASPWIAWCQADLAIALAGRGAPGDGAASAALADQARAAARRLGMASIETRMARNSGDVPPTSPGGK